MGGQSTAVRIATAFTVVLMATTLVLPGRQTPVILERFFDGVSKLSKTAIGQG